MAIDKKKFWENFKGQLRNIGDVSKKVLENLDKQDKEMKKRMDKVLGGVE
jgi:hypothetical protein